MGEVGGGEVGGSRGHHSIQLEHSKTGRLVGFESFKVESGCFLCNASSFSDL